MTLGFILMFCGVGILWLGLMQELCHEKPTPQWIYAGASGIAIALCVTGTIVVIAQGG